MKIVGKYKYDEKNEIGEGAFGKVYKGKGHNRTTPDNVLATKDDDDVAIKEVDVKSHRVTQLHDSISRETQILETVSNPKHNNIVTLLHCEQQDRFAYFVMEFYNGGNLKEYLQSKQKLSESTIRMFLNQIAAGLKAAHDMNIIHRDLKPENILLSFSGTRYPSPDDITLKIADFGIGRFLTANEMARTLCGTPYYMAPEVYLHRPYNFKADLWSVGVIAYECHVGSLPEESIMALIDFEMPSNITPEFTSLLSGLLEKDEKKRFDTKQFINHQFLAVTISVSVFGADNQSKLIRVKDDLRVDNLIDTVCAKYGTDSEAAYLVHNDGRIFERGSGNSLRESGIVHNNTLTLVLRLSGGKDNNGDVILDRTSPVSRQNYIT